jgi:hypothetical protein
MKQFTVKTIENWLMEVSYIVEAETSDEALEKVKSGEIVINDSDNLEEDKILEIVSVDETGDKQ